MRRSRSWMLLAAIFAATLGFHGPVESVAARLARATDTSTALVSSAASDAAVVALKPQLRHDGSHRIPSHIAYLPAAIAAVFAALALAVAMRGGSRLVDAASGGAGIRAPPAL